MDENFFASGFIARKIKLFITSNEILVFNDHHFITIYEDDEMIPSVSCLGAHNTVTSRTNSFINYY